MKNRILEWLFRGYVYNLKNDYDKALQLNIEAFKATLDIKDLIRERMHGVRPTHPDSDTILADHLASLDDQSRLSFLSKAKDVTSNEAFKIVVLSTIIECVKRGALETKDMVEVNFNRASINGAQLIEDELANLTTMYNKEKLENEKMSPEESFAIIN